MKKKKVFYFDEGLKQMDEEKEILNAKRMMASKIPKVRKAGEYKYALLTGQLDELNS